MRLRLNQLHDHLKTGRLAPLYLLCGDEPWQLGEAAAQVRAAARKAGFEEREVLDQEAAFDWSALAAAADALSLFSSRKLIELRLSGARLGKEGAGALRAYCARPCPDNLLLILAPTLERKELQAPWIKILDETGVILQAWPLKGQEFERWIGERLVALGFRRVAPEVIGLIAERAEGNLLAAAQEAEKLRLLHEGAELNLEMLGSTLADSARFDLFALTDAVLAGARARAQRILTGLREEGTPEPLVLWALTRELRQLHGQGADSGGPPLPRARAEAQARARRRLAPARLRALLAECARVDRIVKGTAPGDAWRHLSLIVDALATDGQPPLPFSCDGEGRLS